MNIKITADSTCDLSEELVKKYDIEILPLYIVKDGKSYKDGVEITPSDIFEHVKAGGALTSTAAVNVADYIDAFTPLSKEYDAVIHIDISADFSSCYQNACIAAENFDNVYIIDSRNLSTGSGLVVLRAFRRAAGDREGESGGDSRGVRVVYPLFYPQAPAEGCFWPLVLYPYAGAAGILL